MGVLEEMQMVKMGVWRRRPPGSEYPPAHWLRLIEDGEIEGDPARRLICPESARDWLTPTSELPPAPKPLHEWLSVPEESPRAKWLEERLFKPAPPPPVKEATPPAPRPVRTPKPQVDEEGQIALPLRGGHTGVNLPRSKSGCGRNIPTRTQRQVANLQFRSLRDSDAMVDINLSEWTCGIYFLLRGCTCVYVGQSIKAELRVREHASIGAIDFDRAQCLPVPRELLDEVESYFIRSLRPECNRAPGPGAVDYDEVATMIAEMLEQTP